MNTLHRRCLMYLQLKNIRKLPRSKYIYCWGYSTFSSCKSLIYALNTLGTKQINIVGPEKLIPDDYHELKVNYFSNMDEGIKDADVIIMLRLQKERMHDALISLDTYYDDYGLNESRLKRAKNDVIVMHPGPINRGIEIESTVADGPNSVILNQVSYGISVRMAIMSMLFDNNI